MASPASVLRRPLNPKILTGKVYPLTQTNLTIALGNGFDIGRQRHQPFNFVVPQKQDHNLLLTDRLPRIFSWQNRMDSGMGFASQIYSCKSLLRVPNKTRTLTKQNIPLIAMTRLTPHCSAAAPAARLVKGIKPQTILQTLSTRPRREFGASLWNITFVRVKINSGYQTNGEHDDKRSPRLPGK